MDGSPAFGIRRCGVFPVRLTANLLRPESYAVRIWVNEPPGIGWAGKPYDTVCVIEPIDEYECRIAPCLGTLTDEINVALGLRCLILGFKVMHFEVYDTAKVSRRAQFVRREGPVSHYRVDLLAEAARLKE